MNKKKFTKFIILILTIVVVLVLVMAIIKKIENKKMGKVMGIPLDESQHSLKYTNISELEELSSLTERQIEIARKFEKIFEKEIPNLYSIIGNYDKRDIEEYYSKNNEEIKQNFINIDKDNFVKLCSKIQKMKSNLAVDFDVCDFSRENCTNGIEITCIYNNGEKITFYMSNTTNLIFVK